MSSNNTSPNNTCFLYNRQRNRISQCQHLFLIYCLTSSVDKRHNEVIFCGADPNVIRLQFSNVYLNRSLFSWVVYLQSFNDRLPCNIKWKWHCIFCINNLNLAKTFRFKKCWHFFLKVLFTQPQISAEKSSRLDHFV